MTKEKFNRLALRLANTFPMSYKMADVRYYHCAEGEWALLLWVFPYRNTSEHKEMMAREGFELRDEQPHPCTDELIQHWAAKIDDLEV